MTETWKWSGVVSRQEIKSVQKSKVEGKGKKAKRVVAEEEVFVVTLDRELDGSRIRMQRREAPFTWVIGDTVLVTVVSPQTTLDEKRRPKEAKG